MELRIEGLRKTFKNNVGNPEFSLDISDLTINLGSVTYLMGHNGSGKSVLLKLLCGQLRPTNGDVVFYSQDNSWKAHEHRTAIVRQRAVESLSSDLTVRENLLLRLEPRTVLDRLLPSQRLAEPVINLVRDHNELLKKLDQPCRNLSGGQKQTLAFLAVTAQSSELLCLDEFLAATDHSTSIFLRKLARQYADSTPACVIIASHNVSLALQEADRILILKDGEMIEDLDKSSNRWNKEFLINQLS